MATLNRAQFDEALDELRKQGLQVRLHRASDDTWYVKSEGTYLGYVASGAELLELKTANKLNIHGIKSLG